MHIVRTFSIMRAYGERFCYRKDSKLWKNCIHQKHVWKWLVGGCIPHISPGSAPARIDSNVSYHYTNQPIWLQYDVRQICPNCFEITARTALAQFGYFTLKTKVRFHKGGGVDPPTLPRSVCACVRRCDLLQI